MPIKIPKGFPRRRASGNALGELPNPPEPSFRVLERPNSNSFDGGEGFKRLSHARTLSASHLTGEQLLQSRSGTNPNNRGSGGTNNSASSGGHDNSSASARFSSTSTLPSSTDLPLDDRPPPIAKDPFNMPAPPVPESSGYSLRAAGRALSFGRKKTDQSSTPPRPSVEHHNSDAAPYTRDRAFTESSYASVSTATPPKLLDTNLEIGESNDAFGSMFENFGKRKSQITFDQGALGALRTESPERMASGVSGFANRSTLTPAPLNVDRNREVEPPPSSWTSHNSRDGLVNSGSPMERTFSYEDDAAFSRAGNGPPQPRNMPSKGPVSPTQRRIQQRTPSGGLARSSVYAGKRSSAGDSLDADARLVMDSISASRRLERYSSAGYSDSDDNPAAALVPQSSNPSSSYAAQGPSRMPENRQRSPGAVFDSSDQDFTTGRRQESAETTPRAQKSGLAYHDENSLFDAPTHSGRQAPVIRPKIQPPQKPQTQNKIMTPAQFEQYRREQEMTSTANPRGKQDDSDDEEDDYDDEDEIERAKQAARQRKKQEAHMSVYRQQMMKMTGEQPSDLPSMQLRPNMDRSSVSTPNLHSNVPEFSFDKPSESGKASDDEDDDVPLGVLAAHGFPSKNRPPTATSNLGSAIQYKSESYPPPPASVSGSGGARSSVLPAFARKLPQDPYFGAGLVNPSNRQSLAFGHGGPRSIQGGCQSPVPGPPGGLVGVINAEERARAARRGSPNANGQYGSPLPHGMMPPTIGMPPMMTPTDQATAQMSEQMNQMMQMQMQWMQQMQAMMAGGGMIPPGQQPPFMPGMPPGMSLQQQQQMMMMPPGMLPPPPPGHGQQQQQRPMSTGSQSAPGAPMGHPAQQRAMSMMGPGPTGPWPPQNLNRKSTAPSLMSGALDSHIPGYAGSIAPSERSNVGMPSRYRPVSIAPPDEHQAPSASSRASTFTDGTLQPGRNSRLSTFGDRAQSRLSSLRPPSTSPQPRMKKAVSDDDDEEGWAEMKNKRDKKKSAWRLTRKSRMEERPEFDVYDYPAA